MEGVNTAVATVMGLRVGRYTFRLTVGDQEGATDSASLTIRVQEGKEKNCYFILKQERFLIDFLSFDLLSYQLSSTHNLPSLSTCLLLFSSQKPASCGPRQWQPYPHPAQQLPGAQGVGDRRRPDRGPVPLGQGQPEPGRWGESSYVYCLVMCLWS